jgi:drug/metabolite transporter (DMT)-like permease
MRRPPAAELALFGMTAAWGLSFVVVPRALESCPVMTSIALRAGIGLLFLLALRPRALAATALEWRAGVLGGLLLGGGYVLQTAGLIEAESGKSGFLTAFYICLVPAIESLVYRRIPPGRDLLALVVATAGIALMVVSADLTMSLGEGLVAVAALCWAAHIVVVGRVAERVDAVRLASVQMLVLVIVGAAGALGQDDLPARWSGGFVADILFLGVVTNGLGFFVQAWGQKRVSPTRTAILFAGEPVFAALFGAWLANEKFGVRDALGAATVMAAVALTISKVGAGRGGASLPA